MSGYTSTRLQTAHLIWQASWSPLRGPSILPGRLFKTKDDGSLWWISCHPLRKLNNTLLRWTGNVEITYYMQPTTLRERYVYKTSRHSTAEHRASTRILHLTILGISSDLHPGLLNSLGLFKHRSSPCILRSPPAPFTLWVPLQGLPGYIFWRFSRCLAQPSPFAVPYLQIYSRLLHALPQLFISYLVQPENSQYFPETFIIKDLQLGCYTFWIFPGFTAV